MENLIHTSQRQCKRMPRDANHQGRKNSQSQRHFDGDLCPFTHGRVNIDRAVQCIDSGFYYVHPHTTP
ncbi:Uncharacterised protein [Vibrio cholerae]|nr:Uncharacterised protein [Vibrio cholerae]